VFRPLTPNTPKIELCMVWRRRDNSEALHALTAILRQTFREKSRKHPL
jgi:DNA-binding transcriptional LysR family regulator